ncbi:glycosyltransferase [Roseivivax sp. CAU 1761]
MTDRKPGRAAQRLLCVVLNWRTPEMTLDAVAALARACAGLDAEIVVVDNDSGDGSEERMRAALARGAGAGVGAGAGGPPVRVVQAGRNGGFGAGNNAGIAAGRRDGVDPDLVYIMNSDAFPEPDALHRLIDWLDAHPEAGLAGSCLVTPDGAPPLAGFRFPTLWSEIEGAMRFGPLSRRLRRHQVAIRDAARSGRVDWMAGASLMIRAEALRAIGLFDEAFFLYFEETDLCRRASRAGFEVHCVAESRVRHLGSVSTGMRDWPRVPDYWFDSRWRYFAKHHGRGYAAAATLLHLAGAAFCWGKERVKRRRPADPPHFLRSLARHGLRSALRRPAPAREPRFAPGPAPLTPEGER